MSFLRYVSINSQHEKTAKQAEKFCDWLGVLRPGTTTSRSEQSSGKRALIKHARETSPQANMHKNPTSFDETPNLSERPVAYSNINAVDCQHLLGLVVYLACNYSHVVGEESQTHSNGSGRMSDNTYEAQLET